MRLTFSTGLVVVSWMLFGSPLFAEDYREPILLKVDKNTLTAELSTWPEVGVSPKLIHRFKIAIGKVQGDKEKQGDNKTPEGIYFTQSILHDPGMPEKYGPKAIPLNFPNPVDTIEKKTGYGIWLHGAGNDQRIEVSNVTEGCVAFYNADILKLIEWLKPYQAVVMISKDLNALNSKEDLIATQSLTNHWLQTWRERALDSYMDHYDDSFKYQGMDKAAYAEYKKRVFASYKTIELNSTQVRVAVHEKYAMTIMNQFFKGDDRYKSDGRKILYWKKNSNQQWKIIAEVFEEKSFDPLVFDDAKLMSLAQSASGETMR